MGDESNTDSGLDDLYAKLDQAIGLNDEEKVSVGVVEDEGGKAKADTETGKPEVKPEAKQEPESKEKQLSDKEVVEKYPTLARTIKILAEREAAVERAEKTMKQAAPVGNRELMLEFKRDPITALTKVGFTAEQANDVVRAALAKQLGDKAPDQYKKLLAKTELETRFEERDREMEALREEIRMRDAQAVQATYVTQYKNELGTYLKGAETDAPLVYRMFSKNPDKASQRVMAIVMQDAQEKIAAGKRDAQPLTHAEACKKLNEQLEELSDVFGAKNELTPASKNGNDGSVNLSNKTTRPVGQTAANELPVPFQQHVDAYLKSKGL